MNQLNWYWISLELTVAPLVALVQDEGNELSDQGTMRLTEAQARGILELRLQRPFHLGHRLAGRHGEPLGAPRHPGR